MAKIENPPTDSKPEAQQGQGFKAVLKAYRDKGGWMAVDAATVRDIVDERRTGDKPLSESIALIDLHWHANRGELKSKGEFADRWKWEPSKVWRFLEKHGFTKMKRELQVNRDRTDSELKRADSETKKPKREPRPNRDRTATEPASPIKSRARKTKTKTEESTPSSEGGSTVLSSSRKTRPTVAIVAEFIKKRNAFKNPLAIAERFHEWNKKNRWPGLRKAGNTWEQLLEQWLLNEDDEVGDDEALRAFPHLVNSDEEGDHSFPPLLCPSDPDAGRWSTVEDVTALEARQPGARYRFEAWTRESDRMIILREAFEPDADADGGIFEWVMGDDYPTPDGFVRTYDPKREPCSGRWVTEEEMEALEQRKPGSRQGFEYWLFCGVACYRYRYPWHIGHPDECQPIYLPSIEKSYDD